MIEFHLLEPKTWKVEEIVYAVLAALIFASLGKWLHVVRWLGDFWGQGKSLRQYRKEVRDECEHLIVVGRRSGFSMNSTFVSIDVAPSDLMRGMDQSDAEEAWSAHPVVLVGGPGAGKSTLVKHRILREFNRDSRALPLFLRLRDYAGFGSIEEALAHRFANFGVKSPGEVLTKIFQRPNFVCVLDGLDEVKQDERARVVSDINEFYHKRCSRGASLIVTCRKEAYRDTPLDIPSILEVCPLSDAQIQQFAQSWPLEFPHGKSPATFWRDLSATPKIHELARSPLLLVGGLMQYTESNQGIPGERYQYLQRVASWLIADWATAQGHPPDQLRPLYDRILPRLAFEMHSRNVAELPSSEAHHLIQTWLPAFGFAEKEAESVVKSIRTRTGIMVVDDKNHLVFAQFGLQEFFASIDLTQRLSPGEIATVTPVPWWREAILLAVAQQRDPSPWLDALFGTNPFLATAAVAECPTPSETQQRRAVEASLRGIDKSEKSVTGSVVPLLRKVRGELEKTLCAELERRLTEKKKKARIVGLALATAGTEAATGVLARHPEIWADCLSGAGYLSESFEGLLLGWIEAGTDEQSASAADILATRLRSGVFDQLVSVLPRLTEKKADHVALLLLKHMSKQTEPRIGRSYVGLDIPRLAECVPFVKDRKKHLTEWARISDGNRRLRHSRKTMIFAGFPEPGPVGTSLYLFEPGKERCTSKAIQRLLFGGITWRIERSLLLSWVVAGLLVIFGMQSPPTLLLSASLMAGAFVASAGPPPLPWEPPINPSFEGKTTTLMESLVLITFTSLVVGRVLGEKAYTLVGAALCVALLGFMVTSDFQSQYFNRLNASGTPLHSTVRLVGVVVLTTLLTAAAFFEVRFMGSAPLRLATMGLGIALVTIAFAVGIYLKVCHWRVRSAARDAADALSSELGLVPPRLMFESMTAGGQIRIRQAALNENTDPHQ